MLASALATNILDSTTIPSSSRGSRSLLDDDSDSLACVQQGHGRIRTEDNMKVLRVGCTSEATEMIMHLGVQHAASVLTTTIVMPIVATVNLLEHWDSESLQSSQRRQQQQW